MPGDVKDTADPVDLRTGYVKLIVDIMYHAIKDRRICGDGDGFADDDHRSFCLDKEFECGADELAAFANSKWFERLFDELDQAKIDDVRKILLGN
jgi:hypothetical protein